MSDGFAIEFDERSLEEPQEPFIEVEADSRTVVVPAPARFQLTRELPAGERRPARATPFEPYTDQQQQSDD